MYFHGQRLEDDEVFSGRKSPLILDMVPRGSDVVFIKTPSGNLLTLAVEQTDQVKDIKSQIDHRLHIPCEQQHLFWHDVELNDSDLFFTGGPMTIDLSLSLLNPISIMVRSSVGELIPVQVPANSRVDHMKCILEVTYGVIRDNQTLFFNDRKLKNEDRLQE
jgi:hypothetical protein